MKKMIRWGSPKEYQAARSDQKIVAEQLGDEKPLSGIRKKPPKSKVCRKLKAPHQYGEWRGYHFGWEKDKTKPTGFWERFCTACNRKETWVAPTLPGPYWQLDLTARPPVDK